MQTIYKYPITGSSIEMPEGAEVLHVGAQGHNVFVWAKVDSEADMEKRTFIVVGTGWEVPDDSCEFVGTAQTADGFVWHLYEQVRRTNLKLISEEYL